MTSTLLLMVLVMGGAVVYLLSDINHRQYRINSQSGHLVIERGRRAPFGFESFEPETEGLKLAYAPIRIPPGHVFTGLETVDDRADLDRTLFALLSGWARERLDTKKKEMFDLVTSYLKRCELLPGLSSEQEKELRTLQADFAYRNAQRIVENVINSLEEAVDALKMSQRLGTSRHTDAPARIGQLEDLVMTLRHSAQRSQQTPNPGGLPPMHPPLPTPKRETAPSPKEPETPAPKWRL